MRWARRFYRVACRVRLVLSSSNFHSPQTSYLTSTKINLTFVVFTYFLFPLPLRGCPGNSSRRSRESRQQANLGGDKVSGFVFLFLCRPFPMLEECAYLRLRDSIDTHTKTPRALDRSIFDMNAVPLYGIRGDTM